MKDRLVLSFLTLINVVTHFFWFWPIGYLTYGDAGVYTSVYLHSIIEHPLLYGVYDQFGQLKASILYFPIEYMFALFDYIGLDYQYSFRIILLIPTLAMLQYGGYFLFRKFFDPPIAGICTMFLMFNTIVLQLQTGHLLILASAAACIAAISSSAYKHSNIALFFWIISMMMDIRILYVFLPIVLAYFLVIKPTVTYWIYPVAVSFFGTCILYYVNIHTTSLTGIIDRGVFGSWLFDVNHAMTLSHPMWTGGVPQMEFIKQGLAYYAFLVPVSIIVTLVFNNKINKRKSIIFLILFLFGVFLTKQDVRPLEQSYTWMVNNLPMFSIYRESSKFYWISLMGFLPFLGFLFEIFGSVVVFRMHLQKVAVISFCCLMLLTAKPLITRDIGTIFVPRFSYPEAEIFNNNLYDLNRWNFVQVPNKSRWVGETYYHYSLSSESVKKYFLCRNEIGGVYQGEDTCASVMLQDLKDKNVRFIVIPKDYRSGGDFMFLYERNTYGDRKHVVEELNNIPKLYRIDYSDDFTVFEVVI